MGVMSELHSQIQDTADAVSNCVNSIGSQSERELGKALAKDHRTLQQSKMRMFLAFCEEMAQYAKDGQTDLRNEASCKLAQEIIKLAEKHPLPFV